MQVILQKNECNEILSKYVQETLHMNGKGEWLNNEFRFEINAVKSAPEVKKEEPKQEETIKELDKQMIQEEDLPTTGMMVEEEPKEEPIPQKTHSLFSNLQKPVNK